MVKILAMISVPLILAGLFVWWHLPAEPPPQQYQPGDEVYFGGQSFFTIESVQVITRQTGLFAHERDWLYVGKMDGKPYQASQRTLRERRYQPTTASGG